MMRAKLIIFAMLLLTTVAFAQDPKALREAEARIAKGRARNAALETAINASPETKALAEKVFVASGDASEKAIIEAGKAGDKNVIPLLKFLADYDGSVYAQAALAKFGDEEYLTRIIAETDKTQNVRVRQKAVMKLFLFDNKRAMKRLFELLDDNEYPASIANDVIESSNADLIVYHLSSTAENPPRLPNGRIDATIPAWKAWFARNKHLIE